MSGIKGEEKVKERETESIIWTYVDERGGEGVEVFEKEGVDRECDLPQTPYAERGDFRSDNRGGTEKHIHDGRVDGC